MDPIQCKTTSCRAGLDDRVNRIFFFFFFSFLVRLKNVVRVLVRDNDEG